MKYPIRPRRPGFRYYEFEDETSMYDPKGRYCFGSESYCRTYKIWIPCRLKKENIDDWIGRLQGDEDYWITERLTESQKIQEDFYAEND